MAKLGKILHVFVFFLKLFAVIMSRVTKAQFLWKGLFGICRQAKAVSAQYAIENLSNCTILILLQSKLGISEAILANKIYGHLDLWEAWRE